MPISRVDIPPKLRQCWWVAILLGGSVTLEQVWEETYLTWQHGPQMVGFTLMHMFPFFAIAGLLGYVGLALWLAVVAIVFVRRKALPTSKHLPMIILAVLVLVLAQVPYSFWAALGGVSV